MMRVFGITSLIAAALVLAAPALAGKGGNNAAAATPSTIAIATVGDAALTTAVTAPTPSLGDVLTFTTTVEPLAGWEKAMIAVSCYQDVNGDGVVDTSLAGPDVVFTWLDTPSAAFTLGGYSSIWTVRGGGDATCRADLDAYGWKGSRQSVRVLATTGDWLATG